MTALLTRELFEPHRGTTFLMYALRAIELELIEIGTVSTPPNAKRASFSLRFRANGDRAHVPQQTYRLVHPVLGELEIFIVPMGPSPGGMIYDAIFS